MKKLCEIGFIKSVVKLDSVVSCPVLLDMSKGLFTLSVSAYASSGTPLEKLSFPPISAVV